MNSHIVYEVLNLVGTFVFAISGAVAARQRGLDLFGVLSVSFIVACGGGVIRDVCIGATPPAAFSDWHILAISILASLLTIVAYKKVIRLRFPVLSSTRSDSVCSPCRVRRNRWLTGMVPNLPSCLERSARSAGASFATYCFPACRQFWSEKSMRLRRYWVRSFLSHPPRQA